MITDPTTAPTQPADPAVAATQPAEATPTAPAPADKQLGFDFQYQPAFYSVSLRTRKRARAQIVMLLAQFLLGMGVNLIGLPSETSGVARGVTVAALVGHVAVALGLTVGAILTVRLAASTPGFKTLAWSGLLLVVVTIAAGVLTMLLDSNWWSYLMAVGFAALLVVYGRLYLVAFRDGARRAA